MYITQEWRLSQKHSLSHQFGTGRPDQQDEKELLEFTQRIIPDSEAQRTPAFPEIDHGGACHWCSLNLLPNGKYTSAVCAQRISGRCHSVGQSKDDR